MSQEEGNTNSGANTYESVYLLLNFNGRGPLQPWPMQRTNPITQLHRHFQPRHPQLRLSPRCEGPIRLHGLPDLLTLHSQGPATLTRAASYTIPVAQTPGVMEIPDRIVIPALLAIFGAAAYHGRKLLNTIRPKSPAGGGNRVTLEQALNDINTKLTTVGSDVKYMREVEMEDLRTRVGQMEKTQGRFGRRLEMVEGEVE